MEHAVTTCGRPRCGVQQRRGIEGDVKPAVIDQTEANFDAVMDVNVKGGLALDEGRDPPRCWRQGGGAIARELLVPSPA